MVDVQTTCAADVVVWVAPTGSDNLDTLRAAAPDCLLRDLRELPDLLGTP